MGRKKNLSINLGLAVLIVLIMFVIVDRVLIMKGALGGIGIAELLVDEARILVMPPPEHPWTCNQNQTHLMPDCKEEFNGIMVWLPTSVIRTNSFGIRDREYALEKPPGTFRIFVLGDSFAFCSGVNEEDCFTEIIEVELNARFNTTSFEVFNLGLSGIGTDIEYYRMMSLWQYSPDLVVLQGHSTDLTDCATMKEEVEKQLKGQDLTPEEEYFFGIDYIERLPKERRCSCVRDYLGRIMNMTSKAGIPLVVYDTDVAPSLQCFHDVVSENYYYTQRGFERKHRLSRKDHHLDREGNRVLAEDMLTLLIAVINKTSPDVLR